MGNILDEFEEQELRADEREKAKLVEDASSTSSKGNLIQFRIEEELQAKLQTLATQRYSTPGILAREWVVERIVQEISQNQIVAQNWHETRVAAIKKDVKNPDSKNFQTGPYLIMHVLPLSKGVLIKPADAEKSAAALRPFRKARAYEGTINQLGYESRTRDIPAKAYLQVYRTGEIELVRPIFANEGVINGTFADIEIVDAASTACSALAGWRIPLPYLIIFTVCGLKNLTFGHGRQEIEHDDLITQQVEISRWDQIAKDNSIEAMAQTLHSSLDVFWNAGGIDSSKTFDENNRWVVLQHPGL